MIGFAGLAILATIYSWNEKRLYDKRQLAIELGKVQEDPINLYAPAVPPGWRGWWIVRVMKHFGQNLKQKVRASHGGFVCLTIVLAQLDRCDLADWP